MIIRVGLLVLLLALVFTPALSAKDPQATPLMRSVEPATAKAGDVVTVTGDNLSKEIVLEVYLTDRTDKAKAIVVSQTNTEIKLKVPATIKPGKYWLMVLANLAEPLLIEEPVKLVIE